MRESATTPAASAPLICVRALSKRYEARTGTIEVLRDVALTVARGELVAVVGTSGAGKSTLLHLLGGLDEASGGSVLIDGIDSAKMRAVDLARWRNRTIGFVFQFHHLLPEFTALENVMMPQRIAGIAPAPAAARAQELLVRVGLSERAAHLPAALSGGEQQRVALARALANAPSILLADEPTGNLDEATGAAVFALIREVQREAGLTGIIVTHNPRIAAACDRTLWLAQGRLHAVPSAP